MDARAAINNARDRLPELRFFLLLMDQVEHENKTITSVHSVSDEYAFFLNAFVNAGYGITAYLKDAEQDGGTPFKKRVNAFREIDHWEIYGSGPTGGWRTLVVHYEPKKPAVHGYIPPPGNNVIFRFRPSTQCHQPGTPVNFEFDKSKVFYFTTTTPQTAISDLCTLHIGQLERLIRECEDILNERSSAEGRQ